MTKKNTQKIDQTEMFQTMDMTDEGAFEKVWDHECEVCGAVPTVRATGLCGPCTFGEASTLGGNW